MREKGGMGGVGVGRTSQMVDSHNSERDNIKGGVDNDLLYDLKILALPTRNPSHGIRPLGGYPPR